MKSFSLLNAPTSTFGVALRMFANQTVLQRVSELHASLLEAAAMIPGANPLQYSAAYAQMLGLAGFSQQQQNLAQAASRANPYAAQAAALTAAYGAQQQPSLQASGSAKALTQAVNVKFKNLPFYDIHGELLKPTSLVTQGTYSLDIQYLNVKVGSLFYIILTIR